MAKFNYQAHDSTGKLIKGTVEAGSFRLARQQLRDKKLAVFKMSIAKENWLERFRKLTQRQRMSTSDLSLITRQFATLISAALPLEEVLLAVAQQSEKKNISTLILQIRSKVLEGFSLAQAFSQYPEVFDRLYCAMVSAGEATGKLGVIFLQLADYVEERQKIKSKMMQALTYPAVLTLVAISVISLLLTAVVPKVIEQFIHMKQALPITTRVLIAASDWLREWGLVLLAIIFVIVVIFKLMLRKDDFRMKWHRYLLQMPVIGPVVLSVNTARYTQTLGILTASAVPLIDSMRISASVLNNDYARSQLTTAMEKVREGESLYRTFENTGLFSSMMRHMIASGERSGELDSMLRRASDMQQDALNQRITMALSLFEPLLVVGMASIVLFIILAILQPILQLNTMF